MDWDRAILQCINSRGGTATCQDIYAHIGGFIVLTQSHLRATVYGGRPAYQHEVRSYLSNLVQRGALDWIKRGTYKLTPLGKKLVN
jgi:restriction endonuclease Mrr